MNSHQRRKMFRKARNAFRKLTLPTMGGVFGNDVKITGLRVTFEEPLFPEMPPLFDLKRQLVGKK